MKLSISFLSVKNNIKENIKNIEQTNCDYIHIDIMDGKFVPNTSFSYDDVKNYIDGINIKKDVHLMVEDVRSYIDNYKNIKPDIITFHIEATRNVDEMIKYIKSLGIKVGLSIKPDTSIDTLYPYLNDIDLVLIMSVEPGKGGQTFIDSSKDKIDELYNLRKLNNYNYQIEVDGGINDITKNKCSNADIIVVGSYITNSNDYQAQVNKMLDY